MGRRPGPPRRRRQGPRHRHLRLRDAGRAPGVRLHPVQATIARGRVTAIDTAAAEALDGVLAVLTHDNAERLASTDDAELAVLQSPTRSPSAASSSAWWSPRPPRSPGRPPTSVARHLRRAAARQRADAPTAPTSTRRRRSTPASPTDTADGDVAAAMAAAAVTVDAHLHDADDHNNPLEPHATTALWEPTADVPLTLCDSTQGVHPARAAGRRGVRAGRGAGRGSSAPTSAAGSAPRAQPHANVVLAAMAARALPGPAGQARADPPADVLPRRLPHADHPADAARRRRRRPAAGDRHRRRRADVDGQGVRRADRRRRPG